MNVLMVSQDYPPNIYAGVGRHVGALADALRRHGCHVTVVTTTWRNTRGAISDPDTILVDRAGPPEPICEGTHIWSPIDMLQFNISMAAEGCRQIGFDVVHCHDIFSALAGHVIAGMQNRPLIMTKHFVLEPLDARVFPTLDRPLTPDEQRLYQYSVDLQRWSLGRAERVITVSGWTQQAIEQISPGVSAKCSTIFNGTDLHLQLPLDRPDDRDHLADPVILYVGRLRWKKGCDLLLHAMHQINERNCRLIFAGDGDYRPQLERLAQDLGVAKRVQFVGFLDIPALARAYCDADVVVVPSREEPFGLVASEAMSFGKLVIAARVGGLAEQIDHEENGLLFESGDYNDLARLIRWALRHPERGQQIANRARSFAMTKLTWDAVAEQTIEEYQKAHVVP